MRAYQVTPLLRDPSPRREAPELIDRLEDELPVSIVEAHPVKAGFATLIASRKTR